MVRPAALVAQGASADTARQNWNYHFQQTIIVQYHPNFSAQYSGPHSLQQSEPPQTSLTSTFFIGAKLWSHAALYFNPELAGGNGLSGATGIAGFPNGETFRIGDPAPQLTVARFFITQTIALSDGDSLVSDEANQLAGRQPSDRLTLTFGKICMTDYFDNNRYSHDPRTQFMNWALMANGAWDYPANTRGYTWGVVAELVLGPWAFRLSSAMVPTEANMSTMDPHVGKARSETMEIERGYHVGPHNGVVRFLGYHTQARMGSYQQAVQLPPGEVDVAATREYGRHKYGVGLNIEQSLSAFMGVMFRAGWNDGNNETWMFTEIDQTINAAAMLDGSLWDRADDNLGIAVDLNGISRDHRNYLEAGGLGFIIGDGKLHYAPEFIVEMFYTFSLPYLHLSISPDYQFVDHPAYNQDRGPVHVVGARAHVEF